MDLGEAGAAKVDGGNIAFTFRRVLNQETGSKDGYSEIDIEAEGLRDLLKESIGSNYPGQNFDGETVNMVTPFQPVVCQIPFSLGCQASSSTTAGLRHI